MHQMCGQSAVVGPDRVVALALLVVITPENLKLGQPLKRRIHDFRAVFPLLTATFF